jgi:hypothetical protein
MSDKICLKQETFDTLLSMSLSNCQVSKHVSTSIPKIEPKFVLAKENVYENYQKRQIYPTGTLWNKTSEPVSLKFNLKNVRDNLNNLVDNPRFFFQTQDGILWSGQTLKPNEILIYELRYDIEDPTKDLPIKDITISFTISNEKEKNIYPLTLKTSGKNYVLSIKSNNSYELKLKPPSITKSFTLSELQELQKYKK